MKSIRLTICILLCSSLISCSSLNNSTQCENDLFGKNCDYKKCLSTDIGFDQCKNDGICLQHINTNKMVCECGHEYSGGLCERPRCLTYCYNDGKCQLNEENKMKCICNKRFGGNRCQFDKCLEKKANCPANCYMSDSCECMCGHSCDSNYCNDNGTCYENNGKLACKCIIGYSSPVCSINDCKGYCFSGGSCQRGPTGIYCNCPEGYKSDKRCGFKDIILVNSEESVHVHVPTEYRSTRIIMYALSITLFILMVSIGGYIAIQRGMFTFLLSPFDNSKTMNDSETPQSASYTRSGRFPFVQSNLRFTKLEEDEESIANNSYDNNRL